MNQTCVVNKPVYGTCARLRLRCVMVLGACMLLCGCDAWQRACSWVRAKTGGTALPAASTTTGSPPAAVVVPSLASLNARAATGVVLKVESVAQFATLALTNDLPVMVVFHADQSAPSAAMNEVMADYARVATGKVLVLGADLTRPELRQLEVQYVVRQTPTVVFLRNGREEHRLVGSMTVDRFESEVERWLPVTPRK